MPNAVVCTQCGENLLAGAGDERGSGSLKIVAVVVLLAIVGLAVAWQYGVFSNTRSKKSTTSAGKKKKKKDSSATVASATAKTSQSDPAAGSSAQPDGRFSGGTVVGDVKLDDADAPYEISRTLRVPAGATLSIGPGVTLKVAEGARKIEFQAAGGDVLIEGSAKKPATIAIPVIVSGVVGGLTAKRVVFSGSISVEGSPTFLAERVTFARGLKLTARSGPGSTEWKIVQCDLLPFDDKAGVCLDAHIDAPADRCKVSIARSNLRGRVTGLVGWSSKLDLGGNYWASEPAEALAGMKANGRLVIEPTLPNAISRAGASAGAGGSGVAGKRVLLNKILGFEIAVPEEWRPVGQTMLLAPKKYRHSTKIQIAKRHGVRDPAQMPELVVIDMKKGRARNVSAGAATKITIAGVEGLIFSCTFDIRNEGWVRRLAVVPVEGRVITITLSARAEDIDSLSAAFDEAVKSFRLLGSR